MVVYSAAERIASEPRSEGARLVTPQAARRRDPSTDRTDGRARPSAGRRAPGVTQFDGATPFARARARAAPLKLLSGDEPEGRLRLHELRVAGPGPPQDGPSSARTAPRRSPGRPRPLTVPTSLLGRALASPTCSRTGRSTGSVSRAGSSSRSTSRPAATTTSRSPGTTRSGSSPTGSERPRLARPGRVLHERSHGQRDGVRLPAVRARVRHQQPARLLEHVPRVDGHRAARDDRHRQVDRRVRRLRASRPDHRHGPEPGHEPSRGCSPRSRTRSATAPRSSR